MRHAPYPTDATVRIPLPAHTEAVVASAADRVPTTCPHAARRVLIVDDEATIRQALTRSAFVADTQCRVLVKPFDFPALASLPQNGTTEPQLATDQHGY
jgi:hypothetical protein